MNHKERVLCAIYHEEPDRTPWYAPYGFAREPFIKICKHFRVRNLKDLLVKGDSIGFGCYVWHPSMIEFYRKLDFDLILVEPSSPMGYPKRLSDGTLLDEFGVVSKTAHRATCPRPIVHPINTLEDLEEYRFPNPYIRNFDMMDKTIENFGDDFAIMGGFGFTLFERACCLRGFAAFLTDFYQNPEFAEELLDRVLEYGVKLARQVVKRKIDIYYAGDDYGMQDRMIMSPAIWRRFIKPRLKELLDIPKSRGLPVFLHSDGNIYPIIGDLIEIGVTILNPVQPMSMDPTYVKRRWGDELCLFGTVCTQKTLPLGTPVDVENEVIKRVETLGCNGGLVMGPTHTILSDVPLENFLALFNAIEKYGRYPLRT